MSTDTASKIIDGKAISNMIKLELQNEVKELNTKFNRLPKLAVILVGDDPASHFYVKNKEKACELTGILSEKTVLSSKSSKQDVVATITKYNNDDSIDGILLQLPLPEAIREHTQEIVDTITIDKDVDGLTTLNLGRLFVGSKDATEPCTPKGCIELLLRSNINIQGKKAVVLGRSSLVGKPISIMLNKQNATVTMLHSRSLNLKSEIQLADIVIAAIGKPNFLNSKYFKKDAVIIDVGINKINKEDGSGSRLIGDVDYEDSFKIASAITPVPGGVGPMTVTMLLKNTIEKYKLHNS